jgi:uncharacterized iron-regulated membrane protein
MASIDMPDAHDASAAQPRVNRFYFAAWRWHFYAGIVVIPFTIMLAVTGLVILWFTAIQPEYGDYLKVAPEAQALSIHDQEKAAAAAYPGAAVTKYIAPWGPDYAALFKVDLPEGARMIALDPYTGAVLRDRPEAGTWNEFATAIHGELLIGDNGGAGDLMVEIAASLALLLVVTGLYLWWPRGGGLGRALVPDLAARGRAFWKSLHATTGIWMSVILVFFLITGLAWAGIWGGRFVQAWSTFPAEKWDNVPLSDATHASMNHGATEEVPWAIAQTPMPESGSQAGVAGIAEGTPVTLESVVALGRSLGFEGRMQVAAPDGDAGVWTISQDSMSYDSTDPMADRTVHVDRYTGHVLADVGFANYSAAGKAMAVGIALHEGQMGLWNVVLNTVFCLSILTIAVSGAVMWWMRRPEAAGRLGAPPLPRDLPMWRGAMLIGLLLSMAFPVLGLTLLAVLAVDLLILSRLPWLKRVLS